jgi:Immunity protein 17
MRPFLGTFLALVGFAWIGAGVFDWDWVIGAINNRLFVSVLGRTGTRLFFAFGGVALVVFGILYAADLI